MKDTLANTIALQMASQLEAEAYTIDTTAIVVEKAGSFSKDAGNEYLFVIDELPNFIRLESDHGVYDLNSPTLNEQQEVHSGALKIYNSSDSNAVVTLLKLTVHSYKKTA